MDFVTSALILSWLAILLLALVMSGLVRQVHRLSRGMTGSPRGIGLPAGADAPDAAALLGGAGVLLFLSRECRSCTEALDEAARWVRETEDAPPVHAVYGGTAPDDGPLPASGERRDLFEDYDAVATPFAVVVDATGRVARAEPVGSRKAVRALLETTRTAQSRSSR
ncbi:hypothetical protein LX16_4327 [Stackebrandtia albiflava]|uniref:Thioredoxin domain-containing protein n=1 Tax=Stackebrandtia albiflava TaxID=406432 RepID=A0A562UR73_9ACTN|nr:hypothetical protein [Stackebrandtia albiflava]TWJ08107.1 hypothetical protein LX16_4327 [Stackebrandtia albiflava]